jgi:hypothetical protein
VLHLSPVRVCPVLEPSLEFIYEISFYFLTSQSINWWLIKIIFVANGTIVFVYNTNMLKTVQILSSYKNVVGTTEKNSHENIIFSNGYLMVPSSKSLVKSAF